MAQTEQNSLDNAECIDLYSTTERWTKFCYKSPLERILIGCFFFFIDGNVINSLPVQYYENSIGDMNGINSNHWDYSYGKWKVFHTLQRQKKGNPLQAAILALN